MCVSLVWPSQMHCGITVMQMKLSLWGSGVYQEHACQSRSVLSPRASVPGVCASIHSPKVNISADVNRRIQAAAAHRRPHFKVIDSRTSIIEKREKLIKFVCYYIKNTHTSLLKCFIINKMNKSSTMSSFVLCYHSSYWCFFKAH